MSPRAEPAVSSRVITLLTDFGTKDPFVGVMKGVILRHDQSLSIVDLTHDIEPQNVNTAAFWLARSFPYFPEGTVHVAVVDPGVGGQRRALVAQAGGHWFVVPDNGLLTEVAASHRVRAWELPRPGRAVSATFHGRDVFAPFAARLATEHETPSTLFEVHDWIRIAAPIVREHAAGLSGYVVVVDRFGNLITNLTLPKGRGVESVQVAGRSVPCVQTYAEGKAGIPVALENSWGYLEIAVNLGNASEVLGVGVGEVVDLRLVPGDGG